MIIRNDDSFFRHKQYSVYMYRNNFVENVEKRLHGNTPYFSIYYKVSPLAYAIIKEWFKSDY